MRSSDKHALDADAGIDCLGLVGEQPGHALGLAQGLRSADPDNGDDRVDPMEQEVEPPTAEATSFQVSAQTSDQPLDRQRQGGGRADRFNERQLGSDGMRGNDGVDWLWHSPERLVELPAYQRAKRSARGARCVSKALVGATSRLELILQIGEILC